ncbi:protein UXT isoform X1 [Lissotriton helveticus]
MTSGKVHVQQKILEYEKFINEVLQQDLQKVLEQRDVIYEKIAQYLQLKNVVERLQESEQEVLKMQVDLGCNFFVDAEVPDPSKVFVAIGYGFFAELTLAEALKFIEKKSQLLTKSSEMMTQDAAKIKANIRVVLEGLRELQGLQELPDEKRRDVF